MKTNTGVFNTNANFRRGGAGKLIIAAFIVALVIALGLWGRPAQAVPGTPASPKPVYTEDFENNQAAAPTIISNYVGLSPAGITYTADPHWINNDCNGIILGQQTPNTVQPGFNCDSEQGWNRLRDIAGAIASFNGKDPSVNHIVAAYTLNQTVPAGQTRQFQTNSPIPATPNRFYTFAVDVGATSCDVAHPQMTFSLVDGATITPLNSTPIDPCSQPQRTMNFDTSTVSIGRYNANSPMLVSGSSLSVRMDNTQTSSNGNDAGFDNISLVDVTPQLDKSFTPATVHEGAVTTLNFTVTNTSDLLAKNGWSFTDSLPNGLKVADPAKTATNCQGGVVTAAPGSPAVTVSGGLNNGQASCTASVQVTYATHGTLKNCGANITAHKGILPPETCASVTFAQTLPKTGQNTQIIFAGMAVMALGLIVTGAGLMTKRMADKT